MKIVLYVDDSKHWHQAATLLGQYVRGAGGHVTVLSTLLMPGNRRRTLEEAQRRLDLPPEQVELVGRLGLVEQVLPDVARKAAADLVVVGRLGSADRLTSGRIAHLIAKRTPASVLIARGRPEALRRILVCTEGARHGSIDFERASQLAKVFGASLDVLHVVSQMGLTDAGSREIEEDLRDFLRSDAPEAEHLRDLDARLAQLGIPGRVMVRAGLVVDEVVDAVREGNHDLLVIGAHDIAAPGSSLYEDFASLILRASPVSTLVVRERRVEE